MSQNSYISVNRRRSLCSFQEQKKTFFILSQRASEFEAVGTEVLIANEELALLCSNKRWTARFFEECGLNAPQVVSSANDYTQGFPAMFAVLDEMDNLEKSIMIHE